MCGRPTASLARIGRVGCPWRLQPAPAPAAFGVHVLRVLLLALLLTPSASAALLAIEQVTVIDVVKGKLDGPRTVLVQDGRIAAVGEPGMALPEGAERVDGKGKFLLPGLIDLHVHLFNHSSGRAPNEWTFPLFVAHGVTAVRDMRTQPAGLVVVERWRAAAARGELIAPRIAATTMAIRAANSADAREEVRQGKSAGADFIKIFSELPAASWRAALDEARSVGLPVGGHIPQTIDVRVAAQAGQRSNEHLTRIHEASSTAAEGAPEAEVLEKFDETLCRAVAVALAKADQTQVPTLVLLAQEASPTRTQYTSAPLWPLLRADEQARWRAILDTEAESFRKLAAVRWAVTRRIARILHTAGVEMLVGTDAPMPGVYPGLSLHEELERLVECGLKPAQALRAATFGAAEFLGQAEESGSVAAGRRADLVLLSADPLQDITKTRSIEAVVLGGRLLRRAELDAMLRPPTPR